MATMTPASAPEFIPEVWARDVQMARTNKLIMGSLVDKQYQRELAYGDTVHIVSIAEMTADAITPGTALVPVAPNETEQTLVIDQYYGKAIEIQDMLKRQSKYNLRQPYTAVIGRALATAIDSSLLGQFANVAAAHKMTAVAAVDFADIVEAHTLLDEDNVPMEDRALVVNARILGDLRQDEHFRAYNEVGTEGIIRSKLGIVGTIYGTPVYLTNAVAVNDDSGTDNYQAILFHKSAFAAAIQLEPEMESDRDILKKADLVSGSTLWGVKTVRPDHAVVIRRNV